MTTPTLDGIKTIVRELDPSLDEAESSFKTAVLMLAAFSVGQSIPRLQQFTGFPREFVRQRVVALRANRIWKHGTTFADWGDKEMGGTAFWLDVLVAEGLLRRVRSN